MAAEIMATSSVYLMASVYVPLVKCGNSAKVLSVT